MRAITESQHSQSKYHDDLTYDKAGAWNETGSSSGGASSDWDSLATSKSWYASTSGDYSAGNGSSYSGSSGNIEDDKTHS